VLQPLPFILKFTPEIPKVGTTVNVTGDWFYNIISVTFKGNTVNYTRKSSTSIDVDVPTGITVGGDLVIKTSAGEVTKVLDIDQGFDLVKVADFDGGGLRPANNWIKYGDTKTLIYSNVGGIPNGGNYTEFTWDGSRTPATGYAGCQSSGGNSFMAPTATDASKAFYQIDVNCTLGTVVELILSDSDGGNWAYRYTVSTLGWQTIEANASLFGANYDPSNQGSGDVDPSKINQVKVNIFETGTWTPAAPAIVKFDNIRFKIIR
jgi:hypothetical protein